MTESQLSSDSRHKPENAELMNKMDDTKIGGVAIEEEKKALHEVDHQNWNMLMGLRKVTSSKESKQPTPKKDRVTPKKDWLTPKKDRTTPKKDTTQVSNKIA